MKKGAIFDMDGLLFDTERLYRESWEKLAPEFGQVPNPDFPSAVAGTSGERMRQVVKQYYPSIDAEKFISQVTARVKELVSQSVPEKPGMHELLEYLYENGTKMAVASSSGQEIVRNNLDKTNSAHYFDAIVSGNEVVHSKPAPDIFLLAAQRIGCAPSDCYVFEDGINGTRAGIAAGCTTVMVPDLMPPTEDIKEGCVCICSSLHEVKERIAAGQL